jgi:hypothetical protein
VEEGKEAKEANEGYLSPEFILAHFWSVNMPETDDGYVCFT